MAAQLHIKDNLIKKHNFLTMNFLLRPLKLTTTKNY